MTALVRAGLRAAAPLRPPLLTPALARSVATTAILGRNGDERVPRGHVRPTRARRSAYGGGIPNPAHTYPEPQYQQAYQSHGQEGYQQPPPVHVSIDVPHDPRGVLVHSHAATELLAHDALVIVRQLEMLNVFMGFEQANRYAIYTTDGHLVGYLAEEERGIFSTMQRQFLHTHRPFRATVMDRTGKPVLWIRRPFSIINSRIMVYTGEGDGADTQLVGESQQQWHPWRRKYNIFQSRTEKGSEDQVLSQFGRIDAGLLSWDFWVSDRDNRLIGTINRNFRGLGRELFTDTGQYVIRFDAAGTELDAPAGSSVTVQGQTLVLPDRGDGGLTLDQRAMTLATGISIDFDYFSRHSGSGGMGLPFFMWGGGDGSSEARNDGAGGSGGAVGGAVGGAGGGAAGSAAGGAAGGMAGGMAGSPGEYPPMSDDEIYGRGLGHHGTPPAAGQQAEGFDYPPSGPDEYGEEVMQDPWAQEGGGDDGGSWLGGFFGGDS